MTGRSGEDAVLRGDGGPVAAAKMPAVVDLFAGPGGWSEGLRLIGLTDLGLEIDTAACETRHAAGHSTAQVDVSKMSPDSVGHVDGAIFSPPCTAMSLAGKGNGRDVLPDLCAAIRRREWGALREHEPTVWLPREVGRWIEALEPDWIACEQVPPALALWTEYAAMLREAGYGAWCGVLNAADYGVPQTRERAFLIARKGTTVEPPEATHADGGAATLWGDLAPWVSMADAVGWPESWAISQQRGEGMVERHGERPRRSATEPAFTVTGSHQGSSVGRWLLHTGTNTMKHSRKTEDMVPYMREIERPAPTVDCKAAGAWRCVNGELVRRVTIPEVAAFQSFRPDYPWKGNKGQQGTQIGNAVPPLLAAHVLSAVTKAPITALAGAAA